MTTHNTKLITDAFSQLTDSLLDEFDVVDVLTLLTKRCVDLFDIQAAGVLVVDGHGDFRVMAASSEEMRLLELFQLQNDQGPSLDLCSTGTLVVHPNLRETQERWPLFAPYAVSAGFEAVYALPLRLKGNTLGALNMFRKSPGEMSSNDIKLAQAMADVATIALLLRDFEVQAAKLQAALDSRIVIEQAKGMLSERGRSDMDHAFDKLRTFARSRRRRLTEVAADLVSGVLSLDEVLL